MFFGTKGPNKGPKESTKWGKAKPSYREVLLRGKDKPKPKPTPASNPVPTPPSRSFGSALPSHSLQQASKGDGWVPKNKGVSLIKRSPLPFSRGTFQVERPQGGGRGRVPGGVSSGVPEKQKVGKVQCPKTGTTPGSKVVAPGKSHGR